jgi:hypothetical protein
MMKLSRLLKYILSVLLIAGCYSCREENTGFSPSRYPRLILTRGSVPLIKKHISDLPLLQTSFAEIKTGADHALEKGIEVPIPKDPGGGYTHEQHKQNALDLYYAGITYQITGDDKYARYAEEMLLAYAVLYPTLEHHPAHKDQSPGKLFWQSLNESVWLVYAIQAFDCIYEYLPAGTRQTIADDLFRNMVEFFIRDDPHSINRIHNHGTWACAAVGMTGIVLGDSNYVNIALYGTDKSGNTGFIKQIDELISPDGLYAEGPYYQRYAIMPFMLFARAVDNNLPELKIFDFKENVLNKSVTTLLQLANTDGRFYPFNDAIKEKDILSPELVYAADIAYGNTGNRELLGIAEKHGRVMISDDGLKVAEALQRNEQKEFVGSSMIIADGSDGRKGGIAVLRNTSDKGQISVVIKAGTQGMGHGHFDRLSFIVYENGSEIIQDYGAARFLNIVDKQGGHYLPENNTWAKQTIAHNTVVINQISQFNGKLKEASAYHSNILYSETDTGEIKLVAVADSHCYGDVVLQRTLALINHNNSPLIIDLFRIVGKKNSTYDLPLYYQGHLISSSFDYETGLQQMQALGKQNGYQHLWKVAGSDELNGMNSITWLNNNRFYTYSFLADENSELILTRIGANDPDFNLRNEPGILLRKHDAINHSFISVIEAHGNVDPVRETVSRTQPALEKLSLLFQDDSVSVIALEFKDGTMAEIFLSHFPD